MDMQKYSTGQLYTAGSVNQEQVDRVVNDKEIISSFLINDKCILGSGSLTGSVVAGQLALSPGYAYLKYDGDIKSIKVNTVIEEAQVSIDANTVKTLHNIKTGTTPTVYRSYALYDTVEFENIGEGDGVTKKYPLKHLSNGVKADTDVYINDILMDDSTWNFSDWPAGGQMNKAIEFSAAASEVETINSSTTWDLDTKILSFNLFNPISLTTQRVDITFSGNGKTTAQVANEIAAAIESYIPGSPYACVVNVSKIKLTSGANTGFDMRIQVLPCSAIIDTGGGTYLGFDTNLHTGSGEVTEDDVVYCTYKKEFINYALTVSGFNTITCNSLVNSSSDNPHVPVIVVYEADLNVYYGTGEHCLAQLPPPGSERYDILYIKYKESQLFDKTFFFNDETLVPYQKYAYSRALDSYELGIYSGTASPSPLRVDMAVFYANHPNAIPLCEVRVTSVEPLSVDNDKCGDITGTVNVNYERISDYRLVLDTLEKMRKNRLQIPFKKNLSLSTGSSVINLEVDIKDGYATLNDYIGIATPLGELIYRTTLGLPAPEALENLIFAKISSAIPGQETITLYRGDPQATHAVFTTGQPESLIATYYLNSTFENIPADVFKSVATAGMAVYDGGALTKLRDHLNDTTASLFTIDYGDVSYTMTDGKLRWSGMRFIFRDTNGSYFNDALASSAPTEFSPIDGEYIYVLLNRSATLVQDNYVKHSLDPWAAHPGREYDVFIIGQIIDYGAGLQLQRARHGQLWNETRRIYSNLNITQYGDLFFSGAIAKLTWGDLEFSFYNHIGTIVKNTVTGDGATGLTLVTDEYAYIVLDRIAATVKDNIIKKSMNPWATEAIANMKNMDADIVILGQCKGLSAPYKFVLTLGGGGSGGAGGEWVTEDNAPVNITGVNQIIITDIDGSRNNTYNPGRFLRIQMQGGLGAGNYYYCQVYETTWLGNIATVTVENVRDKDGNLATMPTDGTMLSLEYSAMQMRYMGVGGDVNPLNKSLLDHVKDFSIHTTYKYVLRTQDLSSQVGVGGPNIVFAISDEGNINSFSIYVNGLLLMPDDVTVLSPSSVRVNISLTAGDLVSTSFVLYGQEQDFVFNEELTAQGPGSVFTTANNFISTSIQVFRNGAKISNTATPNGFTVTDVNEITLQTALEAWETLSVHYDKTGATNVVIFNENISDQTPGFTYSVEHAFFPDSVVVYRNGILVYKNANALGYFVSGSRSITFNSQISSGEEIIVCYNRQWSQVGALVDLTDVNIEDPAQMDSLKYVGDKWINVTEIYRVILRANTLSATTMLDISSVPFSGIIPTIYVQCLVTPNLQVAIRKISPSGVVTTISGPQLINTIGWHTFPITDNTIDIEDVVSLDVTNYTSGAGLVAEVAVAFNS